MNEDIDNILSYWFGIDCNDVIEGRDDLWIEADHTVDGQIKRRFSGLIMSAGEGRLDAWAETARGSLALIVLLDQFTRNVYRGSGEAFSYDEQARTICQRGIQRGLDQQLSSSERIFYYLPLEHSEFIEDQKQCVQLFKRLAHNVEKKYAGNHVQRFTGYVDYAVLHYDIIAAYGRFPHRNVFLGRKSTLAESAYLKEGGPTFGQAINQ